MYKINIDDRPKTVDEWLKREIMGVRKMITEEQVVIWLNCWLNQQLQPSDYFKRNGTLPVKLITFHQYSAWPFLSLISTTYRANALAFSKKLAYL